MSAPNARSALGAPGRLMRSTLVAALHTALGMGSDRECNLCGWTGSLFAPRTDPRKPSADAFCPRCGSAERHRLTVFALAPRLPEPGRTLHIAPEPAVARWLAARSRDYLSCDLDPAAAMECQDLTALSYDTARFDLVWCSNVLEHVPDDAAAMREMRRVLAPGGLCVVQVPVWRRVTFEDPSVTEPEERRRLFGQTDHVRLYGMDIAERLGAAGFEVELVTSRDFDPRDVGRHGLDHLTTREIFLCS